jgi:hypothetical protein
MAHRRALTLLMLLPLACRPADPQRHDPGDLPDDTGTPDTGDSDADTDTDTDTDTEIEPAEGCRAEPLEADRDRLVVVSYPYSSSGSQANSWGVFTLDTSGALRDSGARVDMGRANGGHVAFTPDGSIGMVAQDDGSVGVFEAVSASEVRVVHRRFEGGFYASAVVSDPSGEVAWIVDGNWANNGGGLYRASIDCDSGELGPAERVVEAKLPSWLGFLHRRHDRAVLVGREADGAQAGEDAFLLEPGQIPSLLDGADLFGDDEATTAGSAISFDDATLLVGDYSFYSGIPNRVAVAALSDGGLAPLQVLDNIDDPVDIVASPYADKALVLSGYSDALFVLDYVPGAAAPYSYAGEPSYQGASPQLPTAADQVTRGSLRGLVVLTENQGLRRVRFSEGGVDDLGLSGFGSGLEWIPGAIGIQP